ncbi:hypothetical protein LEMLEM_LOCUS5461 [Lemmus lemmus]
MGKSCLLVGPSFKQQGCLSSHPRALALSFFFINSASLLKAKVESRAVVAHAFNPSTREAETGGSL